jgi:hypothetical protein
MVLPAVVIAFIPAAIVQAIFGAEIATGIVFVVIYAFVRYVGMKAVDG